LVVLLEFLKNPLVWDIKVLGTDISTRALVLAQKGVYDAVKLKTVSPLWLERYFEPETIDGERAYRVKDELKQLTLFRRFNLMEDKFPFHETFDIIFCRNVMIYFDKDTQRTLVNKLYGALKPGGYFFIGHSESLIGLQTPFKSVRSAIFAKIRP
jgi:chemotaxis protein methyltransferase CheR